jgi:hypothetical protein
MLIKNLFERDIFRPINGVLKADQLDDSSVWQELDEFVITQARFPLAAMHLAQAVPLPADDRVPLVRRARFGMGVGRRPRHRAFLHRGPSCHSTGV